MHDVKSSGSSMTAAVSVVNKGFFAVETRRREGALTCAFVDGLVPYQLIGGE
jgi:hypothetical protein